MRRFFFERRDEEFGKNREHKEDNRLNTRRKGVKNEGQHDKQPHLKIPIRSNIIVLPLQKKAKIALCISRLGIDTQHNDNKRHVENKQERLLDDI